MTFKSKYPKGSIGESQEFREYKSEIYEKNQRIKKILLLALFVGGIIIAGCSSIIVGVLK